MILSNSYMFETVFTEKYITIKHQLTYTECLLHTYKTLLSTCLNCPLGWGWGLNCESACPQYTQLWVSSPTWQQMNNSISTPPRSWWPLPLHTRRNQDRVLSTFPKVTQLINYDLREKVPESIL